MSVASLRKASCIGQWLNIDPAEQHVVVTSGKVEIGQRIDRALRGIVCAELALDPKRVVSRPASTLFARRGLHRWQQLIEQFGVALRLALSRLAGGFAGTRRTQTQCGSRRSALHRQRRICRAARGCAGCVVGTLGC